MLSLKYNHFDFLDSSFRLLLTIYNNDFVESAILENADSASFNVLSYFSYFYFFVVIDLVNYCSL